MRQRILGIGVAVVAMASMLVTTGSTADAASAGPGGEFVPVTPTVLVNATSTGSGRFGTNETRTYPVLGHAGVPATGVAAVLIEVSVPQTSATSASGVTVWPSGKGRPSVPSVAYVRDSAPRSNQQTVKLYSPDGSIDVHNGAGPTSVVITVEGYVTALGTSNPVGGFEATPATRVLNTTTGSAATQIQPGHGHVFKVGGVGAIPADATAVFANIEIRNATAAGSVRVGAAAPSLSGPSAMSYGVSGPYDSGAMIRLDSEGRGEILNVQGSPIDVKVDVQGYVTADSARGGSYNPMRQTVIYSTEQFQRTQLQPGESREISVDGPAWMTQPDPSVVRAVALTMQVKDWTRGGTGTVYNSEDGYSPNTNASFAKGVGDPANGITTTAITSISSTATVVLHNTSSAPVTVNLNLQGWFSVPRENQ